MAAIASAVVISGGPEVAHDVTDARGFNLDDIGSLVAEYGCGHGACNHCAEIDYFDSAHGSRHTVSPQ
jgi:hypothetical protein